MARYAVVVAAAGQSRRFNENATVVELGQKKPFVALKGRPVFMHSVELFAKRADVVQIVLIVSPEDSEAVKTIYAKELERYRVDVVLGGAERFLSVENALNAVRDDVDFIAVHDAARPCVTNADVDAVFAEAARTNAAILAAPVVGSLKRAGDNNVVAKSESRVGLWEALTPQVVEKELLLRAYRERPVDMQPTDDCGLVEALGVDVSIVRGSRMNIKITSPEDLLIAEKFMEIVAAQGEGTR